MLMYGTAYGASLALDRPNTKFYNLSSLNESFNVHLRLVPPNSLGANSEYDFDVKYMEWIFNNDNIFMMFMNPIMDMYNGMDVFIVICDDEWSLNLIDSLMKLIQTRYGINGVFIESQDDLYYAEESTFNDYGVINLDADKERYTYMMVSMYGIQSQVGGNM